MSIISFGGLATGLDTGAIVAQLVAIRRQPIVKLDQQKSLIERQRAALVDLRGKLEALREAAAALDTWREFGSVTAASSHENLVRATANPTAAPGSYELVVSSLARAQKEMSQGYDSAFAEVGSGVLRLTVGDQTHDIVLAEGSSSLTHLRDAINDAGVGVYATILNDGGEDAPYRLILSAASTGTDSAFSIDASGLGGGVAPSFTTITAAANASLTIDGVPVVAQTNQIAGALEGVTFELLAADPAATVSVTIANDPQAIGDKVQSLVDAYNDLRSFLKAQQAEGGVLRGQGLLRSVAARLQGIIGQPLAGEGRLTLLPQIGVSQDREGVLSFDRAKFDSALADDYAAVRDLLVERGDNLGKAYQLRVALADMTDDRNGLFRSADRALDDRVKLIERRIERYERSVESYELTLQRQFTAMEAMVQRLQAQSGYLASRFGY